MNARRTVLIGVMLAIISWWQWPTKTPVSDPTRVFQLYDFARYFGQNDRLTPLPRDPERHASRFAEFSDVPNAQTIYRGAYNDGFDQHPDEPMSESEACYDHDYRQALRDQFQGKAHSANSAPGYQDALSHRAHRFDRPY